jgi:TetR/AcrR family transcriptional regulator, cholesterol catabolism regulator
MNRLRKTLVETPRPSARAGRRERNKAEKLERIRQAARKLFGQRGFARTSIHEVAAAADVAVGTIFLYARNKEDLLVLCFRDEVGAAIDEGFRTLRRGALLEQVLHVFRVMIAHNAANLELARIFTREIPFAEGARSGVREVMEGFHRRMEALIVAAQDAGEIRVDVPPAKLGHNLWALYFHFLLRWLGSGRPDPAALLPTLREMLELQLVGLRAEKPTRGRAARETRS